MIIRLIKNISERKVMNKQFSSQLELEGFLRDESSVVDPTFTVQGDVSLADYNYCYIPDFHRFYFIADVTMIATNLWQFTCHVDVLTSNADKLRNMYCIIYRQENNYDMYLDDSKLKVRAPRQYWTKSFPNRISPGSTAGANSFILTMTGGKKE